MVDQMSETARPQTNDDINLLELVDAVWRRRRMVIGCAVAALMIGILYLHLATYKYTAELKVTPAQSSSSGSLSSKIGGLSGLASLAGVNIPQDQSATAFLLYIEGVHSRPVADALAQRTDLMKVAFEEEWDERQQRFVERKGLRPAINAIKVVLGIPVRDWAPPNGARLQEFMTREIRVVQDSKSPVATIAMDHEDPQFAKAFLGALNEVIDDMLRRKALARADQYINYITAKLPTITIAEHREALTQALSEQEKLKMMASSSVAYAAEPFGPPSSSYRPTSPRPIIVLAASFIGGLLVGITAAILRRPSQTAY